MSAGVQCQQWRSLFTWSLGCARSLGWPPGCKLPARPLLAVESCQQERCQAWVDSGLSAWELACHAFLTTIFAAQRAIFLVRECPLQTVSDRAIGYATARCIGGPSGLTLSMRTTGAYDKRTTSAASKRCPRSCTLAVVRPCCCTSCRTELTL